MTSPQLRPTLWPSLLILLLPLSGCADDARRTSGLEESDGRYSYTGTNSDGIGKYYMEREISWVMGHQGAGWLERSDREQEERTDLLLENLPINAGDTVADIGAGTGYFSLPMAEIVGETGKVFAVDVQPEMLAIIEEKTASANIENIERVLAQPDNPGLPANSINLVLFVDVYHELEWPWEVMTALRTSLKPGGYVVLAEYRGEDPFVPIKRLHKMTEKQVRKEMAAVGLEFVENGDFLPQQHFLVFRKPVDIL